MNPPQAVASPCRQVCRLDVHQVCVGCGRHIAEIAEWAAASAERKHQIRALAQARLATHPSSQDQ